MKNKKIKKVAIQGITASFHDEATHTYFSGEDIAVVECKTFKDSFDALKNGDADYLVVAIENTLVGGILENYNLVTDYNFFIVGELFLTIRMCLLGNEGSSIKEAENVMSHPMALKQCADYLLSYPHLKMIEASDTAKSAQTIKQNKTLNTLAISSSRAAEMFDLNILETNIETNKKNFTRFLILTKKNGTSDDIDKASLCFQVGHEVGALYKTLGVFHHYGINMSKIQSMPVIGKPSHYKFYVDLEWDEVDSYRKCIPEILKFTKDFNILGEYKRDRRFLRIINN